MIFAEDEAYRYARKAKSKTLWGTTTDTDKIYVALFSRNCSGTVECKVLAKICKEW